MGTRESPSGASAPRPRQPRPRQPRPQRPHAALAAGLAALAPGCAARAHDVALPAAVPATFSRTGEVVAPERWWTAFGDPALDGLVAHALRSNFELDAAWQRLRQAAAIAEREEAFLYPDLLGEADGSVQSPEREETASVRLGLSSVYEADLWGRIRSSVEAEEFRARATLADYRTAAISLSAEVARTWFQLVEATEQRDLLEEQIETNEQVLGLIEARFGTGQIRRVDLLRQEQLVEATRSERLVAEARAAILENLLAVLLGRPPQAGVDAVPRELPALPPLPRTGLPADLVRRRPDVQRAFELLQAADRELAAAIADRYPRLTLSASVSTAEDGPDELFTDWMSALAGGLVAPLFDAGLREAEVHRAEALRAERLNGYGQATLVAFREVEDALAQEVTQVERLASIERQVALADRAYEQLRIEYFNGVGDYIDVLTSLTDLQELRRSLLTERLALLELRIALYRALAGGFTTGREVSL